MIVCQYDSERHDTRTDVGKGSIIGVLALRLVRLTHLVVSKADASVLSLGARAFDEFGKDEHAEKEDGSENGKDSAGDCVLGANVEPVVIKTCTASCGPLLLAGNGVVLEQ